MMKSKARERGVIGQNTRNKTLSNENVYLGREKLERQTNYMQ
jgi:hypothetical protein